MLPLLLPLLALATVAPAPAPASVPALVREEAHGKIPWFQGTFAEARALAVREKKLVFIDFWTTWCGWCKKLDRDTYSDERVLAATQGWICLNIDAESETGAPIAREYPINGFPTMIVLEPDGSVREVLSGYLPPAAFLAEVERITANRDTLSALRAAAAAEGAGVDARWKYASRLMEIGDEKGVDAQVAAIRKLDPEGKSLAMHYVAFQDALKRINELWQQDKATEAPAVLKELIAKETYPEVQVRAWNVLGQVYGALAGQAKNPEDATRYNLESRTAQITAWRTAPDRDAIGFGKQVLNEFYGTKDRLGADDKEFALEVAERLRKLAPEDAEALDLVACAHFLNGRKDEALALVKKAIELDPKNVNYAKRLSEFGG